MVLTPTISPWPGFIYPPLSTILIWGYVHQRHCGVAMDCRGNIISGGTPNTMFLKPFYSTVHHPSILLCIHIYWVKPSHRYCVCRAESQPWLLFCLEPEVQCWPPLPWPTHLHSLTPPVAVENLATLQESSQGFILNQSVMKSNPASATV